MKLLKIAFVFLLVIGCSLQALKPTLAVDYYITRDGMTFRDVRDTDWPVVAWGNAHGSDIEKIDFVWKNEDLDSITMCYLDLDFCIFFIISNIELCDTDNWKGSEVLYSEIVEREDVFGSLDAYLNQEKI